MFQPVQIVLPSASVQQQLNFPALAVDIDNFTNQWWLERSTSRFIQPYFTGITLPVAGAQVGDLVLQSPPSFPQVPQIPGQVINAIYLDKPKPGSAGTSIAALLSPSGGLPVDLTTPRRLIFGNLTTGPPHFGTFFFDYPEDPDLVGLILYFDNDPSSAGTVTLTISQHDAITGADMPLLFRVVAIGETGTLTVYPGIPAVANVAASEVVGHTPRIKAVIGGGPVTVLSVWAEGII